VKEIVLIIDFAQLTRKARSISGYWNGAEM